MTARSTFRTAPSQAWRAHPRGSWFLPPWPRASMSARIRRSHRRRPSRPGQREPGPRTSRCPASRSSQPGARSPSAACPSCIFVRPSIAIACLFSYRPEDLTQTSPTGICRRAGLARCGSTPPGRTESDSSRHGSRESVSRTRMRKWAVLARTSDPQLVEHGDSLAEFGHLRTKCELERSSGLVRATWVDSFGQER